MGFQVVGSRFLTGAIVSFATLFAVAGCQSGGGGAFDSGAQSRSESQSAEGAEVVRESDLRKFCPPVRLNSGTAYFTTYKGGDETDPQNVIYQASISDVTRSCSYTGSGTTVTVAVAGKVVPGPSGRTGTVTMPIRIAAKRGDSVIYSKIYKHQVTINDTAEATQFVFTDPNVAIGAPVDGSVQVLAGYDEGASTSR